MPLSAGQILNNRYRIETLLGQGGFGAVYKAWDLNLERWRALKENLDASPEAQRQFKREAQILCDLAHPNLPRVIDHFVIPDPSGGSGSAYLVMDFVEGEDLEHMMGRNAGPLPEAQVIGWLTQVCDALEYLHSQQPPVIHRDIKPANIKVTSAGKAVLVDFGIAKLFDPNLRTSVGARAYTSGYSPPEQYGRGATDAQSDIYALGATAYHLLTNRLPPDSMDIVSGNTAPLRSAHEINATVSPQVSDAVAHAMEINKANRWRRVAELKAALVSYPGEQTAVIQHAKPHAQTVPLQVATSVSTSRKRSWFEIAGLGLAGVVLLGLVIWGLSSLFSGGRRTPTPERSQLSLTTEAPQTKPVDFESTATRFTLLTAMSETQQAMQILIFGTQTALAENHATYTAAVEEAATGTAQAVNTSIAGTSTALVPARTTQTAAALQTSTQMAMMKITPTSSEPITDSKGVPMALIPAGEFQMGSENGSNYEKPAHTLFLDAFYIDVYEVTNSRYAECVSAGACQPPKVSGSRTRSNYYGDTRYADYPMITVTWNMAKTYCKWRGGGLPTEAQWEKAARGGLQVMDYPWGNDQPVCDKGAQNGANFTDCGTKDTKVVGSYSPNGYGLFDMAGNVWEWVNDWYQSDYYTNSPDQNPPGASSGDYKVLRGGCLDCDLTTLRVAYRIYHHPLYHSRDMGFRCVVVPGR